MQTHFTMLLFAAGKAFLGKWTIIIWRTSRSRKDLSSFSHNRDLFESLWKRRRGIAIVSLIYFTVIVSKMHTHTKIQGYVQIQNCIPVEWGRMEIGYKMPHLLSFSNSQILRTSSFIVVVLMISVQVHHASQQSFALRVLNKIRNTLDWFSAPPLYSLCPNGFC